MLRTKMYFSCNSFEIFEQKALIKFRSIFGDRLFWGISDQLSEPFKFFGVLQPYSEECFQMHCHLYIWSLFVMKCTSLYCYYLLLRSIINFHTGRSIKEAVSRSSEINVSVLFCFFTFYTNTHALHVLIKWSFLSESQLSPILLLCSHFQQAKFMVIIFGNSSVSSII